MASGGHKYTLVGFSEDVDRRPLFFVQPIPWARLCSACGLVPIVKALLPCEHSFCKPCYEQCERSGSVACPLDGDTCSEEEVAWINHPPRSILGKEVLCWNHSNGCNVVLAAADISKHFHHECGHHLARCLKCAAEIPASDVCAHLESSCDASSVSSAAGVQRRQTVSQEQEPLSATCSEISDGSQRIYNVISMSMSTIQSELKEISRTLKIGVTATTSRHGETGEGSLETRLVEESLSQVRIQTAKLNDQLDQFMHNVNANQQTFHNSFVEKYEALKQSLTHTLQSTIDHTEQAAQFTAFREATEDRHRETKAAFDQLSMAINRQYDLINERLLNTYASQETETRNSQEAAEAHAESLAQNASEIAWAKTSSAEDRRNALAILPSIRPVATTHTWTFEEYDSLKQRAAESRGWAVRMLEPVYLLGYCVSVGIALDIYGYVYLKFKLHKGVMDQYLEWPFNLEIKWSILHPHGTEKLERCVIPSSQILFKDRFSRPNEVSSEGLVDSRFCTTAKLEKMGFIKDGRMLLRLELEPTADHQP